MSSRKRKLTDPELEKLKQKQWASRRLTLAAKSHQRVTQAADIRLARAMEQANPILGGKEVVATVEAEGVKV